MLTLRLRFSCHGTATCNSSDGRSTANKASLLRLDAVHSSPERLPSQLMLMQAGILFDFFIYFLCHFSFPA